MSGVAVAGRDYGQSRQPSVANVLAIVILLTLLKLECEQVTGTFYAAARTFSGFWGSSDRSRVERFLLTEGQADWSSVAREAYRCFVSRSF